MCVRLFSYSLSIVDEKKRIEKKGEKGRTILDKFFRTSSPFARLFSFSTKSIALRHVRSLIPRTCFNAKRRISFALSSMFQKLEISLDRGMFSFRTHARSWKEKRVREGVYANLLADTPLFRHERPTPFPSFLRLARTREKGSESRRLICLFLRER